MTSKSMMDQVINMEGLGESEEDTTREKKLQCGVKEIPAAKQRIVDENLALHEENQQKTVEDNAKMRVTKENQEQLRKENEEVQEPPHREASTPSHEEPKNLEVLFQEE